MSSSGTPTAEARAAALAIFFRLSSRVTRNLSGGLTVSPPLSPRGPLFFLSPYDEEFFQLHFWGVPARFRYFSAACNRQPARRKRSTRPRIQLLGGPQ